MAYLELVREDGGRIQCDTKKRSITFFERTAIFTESEWKILRALYYELGQTVSRETLFHELKDPSLKEDSRCVDMHISNIRRKLKKVKAARIVAVYGEGYRLLASYRK